MVLTLCVADGGAGWGTWLGSLPGQCLQQNVLLLLSGSFHFSALLSARIHFLSDCGHQGPTSFTRSMACLSVLGLLPWPGRDLRVLSSRLARDLKPSTEEGPFRQRREPSLRRRVCLLGFLLLPLRLNSNCIENHRGWIGTGSNLPREHLYFTR